MQLQLTIRTARFLNVFDDVDGVDQFRFDESDLGEYQIRICASESSDLMALYQLISHLCSHLHDAVSDVFTFST
jgi:NADH:ubiquinone oxidoreductase subunit E